MPGSFPHRAREVPEVDGLVVGDDEDLAVDFLAVERRRGERGCGEQCGGCEEVGVRYVAYVGEVEEVFVVAELEAGFSCCIGCEDAGDELNVALAEDGSRTNGGGEEGGVRGRAVGGYDCGFCYCLWN